MVVLGVDVVVAAVAVEGDDDRRTERQTERGRQLIQEYVTFWLFLRENQGSRVPKSIFCFEETDSGLRLNYGQSAT